MSTQPAIPAHTARRSERLADWMTGEPAIIVLLVLAAGAFFAITHFYAHSFQLRRDELAQRWFQRGDQELRSGKPSFAVDNLRTALAYSPEDAGYRQRLAQALALAGRTNEARAYFRSLWESQPGNGLLNLELARLAVRQNDIPAALRFFHGAIYGVWGDDPQEHRRQARLELIRFLLDRGDNTQADAEIVGLAADSPDNATTHVETAGLFSRAQDFVRALLEYVAAVNLAPRNAEALAGAGQAAFQLGRYRTAARYLQEAVKADPSNLQASSDLATSTRVLDLDPYLASLPSEARRRRVIDNFQTAGARLESCAAILHQDLESTDPTTPLQIASSHWKALKPSINDRDLRRDPDLIDAAMNLVFDVERQTRAVCGAPSGADLALTLLASAGRDAER